MLCNRPLRRGGGAARRNRPLAIGWLGLVTLLVAWSIGADPAVAQERWLFQGLADAEFWNTDGASRLLGRNNGDPVGAGEIRIWMAGRLHPRVQAFALGEFEGASDADGIESELEQAFVRISLGDASPFYIEGGKLTTMLGNFSSRYFSNVNPLIGSPDGYQVSYPIGIQLVGRVGRFDLKAGVVDLPLVNEKYVPEPGSAPRPVAAAGITPIAGLRLGAYYTGGPYLNDNLTSMLPAGEGWKDFKQLVTGFDFHFSRGHFELNADYNRSRYEVPTHATASDGEAYFIEPKYTWTPRFFTAVRFESNDYVYIMPVTSAFWIGSAVKFHDIEAGIGFRAGPDTILKLSYRVDRWKVDGAMKAMFPDGHALAFQLSHTFDVLSWTTPQY